MQAEEQHRRREQAGVVDAHGVHPFQRHADVAVMGCAGLSLTDVVPAQLVAGDAAADVLIADLAAQHRSARPPRFADSTACAADHRAFDVLEHVLVGFALVVVRVDVDDEEILIVALARLLGWRARDAARWNSPRRLSLRTSLRTISMGALSFSSFSVDTFSSALSGYVTPVSRPENATLSDDEDVVAAPDHVVLLQPQPAVADAFAGLELVFVAVPRADEMHVVGECLALIGAVGVRSRRPPD